jgi:hypothetical protein
MPIVRRPPVVWTYRRTQLRCPGRATPTFKFMIPFPLEWLSGNFAVKQVALKLYQLSREAFVKNRWDLGVNLLIHITLFGPYASLFYAWQEMRCLQDSQ